MYGNEGGKGGVLNAWRLVLLLGAMVMSACSESDERCEADETLAEACARGGCPRDLSDAVAQGRACEGVYFEAWRNGDQRALGADAGEGGLIYHFQGDQLVGREGWTDVLGDCPISYVNGSRVLRVHDYGPGRDSSTVERCAVCADWVADERPLCTAEQLGVAAE